MLINVMNVMFVTAMQRRLIYKTTIGGGFMLGQNIMWEQKSEIGVQEFLRQLEVTKPETWAPTGRHAGQALPEDDWAPTVGTEACRRRKEITTINKIQPVDLRLRTLFTVLC